MKMQQLIKTATAALAFGIATQASAAVITLNASGLPAGTLLTSGTHNGSFDGAALLPDSFTVNSLTFGFKFTDDSGDPFNDVPGIQAPNTTLTSTSGQNRTATYTTEYFIPVTSTGERESVALSFGALTLLGQTAAGSTGTTSSTGPTTTTAAGEKWVKVTGSTTTFCTPAEIAHDNSCKKVSYFTATKTTTVTTATDYTGTITFEGTLLTSLFQNKKLDFTLGVTGDLFLTSAALDVDFTENQKAAAANAVPEPGSLALFGLALASIAGFSRKRRA